jgi:hypothetical protein
MVADVDLYRPSPAPGGKEGILTGDSNLTVTQPRWARVLAASIGVGLLLWLLAVGSPPRQTLFWRELFNLGHIPLFGLVALLALEISRGLAPVPATGPVTHYLVAFVMVALIRLVSEMLQFGAEGREAEVQDAVHNLIGAICFLAIRAGFDRQLWPAQAGPQRTFLMGAAGVALFVASWPLVALGWHYGMRAAAFPVVVDFDSRWQQPFISSPRADLGRAPAPDAWRHRTGDTVSVIRFLHARWPGVTIREPSPDWSAMNRLRVQLFSPLEQPVRLTLRIDDEAHNHEHKDRFNRTFTIEPGLNELVVPMEDIRRAPADRDMDLRQIARLIFFTNRPSEPFELFISDVWLE